MFYVIAVAVLAAAILTFFRPFVGLLALLAINVIQPGELYPAFEAIHLERIMAVLVLLSSVLHSRPKFYPLTRKILIFWGVLFATIPLAVWRTGAALTALSFGKVVIYNVLIANLIDTKEKLKYFLLVYVLLIGYLGASTFYFGSTTNAQHTDRAIGLTSDAQDPNHLAGTLVICMPVVLLIATSKGLRAWRLISLATLAVCVATVVFTGSRSGFIALVLICGIAALRHRWRFFLIPVALAGFLLIWTFMPAQYQNRYSTVEHLDHDDSYQERIAIWKGCFQEFLSNPITGVGAGQASVGLGTKYGPEVYGRRIWMQPHSLYLQMLAETGLAGTIAFFLFAFAMIRENLRLRVAMLADSRFPPWMENLPYALLFGILALFILGYAGHNLYRSTWYEFAGMTSALSVLVAKQNQETESEMAESEPEPSDQMIALDTPAES